MTSKLRILVIVFIIALTTTLYPASAQTQYGTTTDPPMSSDCITGWTYLLWGLKADNAEVTAGAFRYIHTACVIPNPNGMIPYPPLQTRMHTPWGPIPPASSDANYWLRTRDNMLGSGQPQIMAWAGMLMPWLQNGCEIIARSRGVNSFQACWNEHTNYPGG